MRNDGSGKQHRLRRRGVGRPRSIPAWEAARRLRIEHYVLEQLARHRTPRQIAAQVGFDSRTVRDALAERHFQFNGSHSLVYIGPPDPAESRAAAGGTPVAPGPPAGSPPERPARPGR